jgi:uncharacterized protein YfbU (UPF0304 family)
MGLTDTDNLILMRLEKLGDEGDIDSEFVQRAMSANQLWGLVRKYPDKFGGIKLPQNVLEVINILRMWELIEITYGNLPAQERIALKNGGWSAAKFPGFDAINESRYLGIAKFLIDDCQEFPRFKGRAINSQRPFLNKYRDMLMAFRVIPRGRTLNAENLREILRFWGPPGR